MLTPWDIAPSALWVLANLSLAALVLRAASRRWSGVLLALTLTAGAISAGTGLFLGGVEDRTLAYRLRVAYAAADILAAYAYLAFIGVAVPAPLARPLGLPWVRTSTLALGGALAAAIVLMHPLFAATPISTEHGWRSTATALGAWVSILSFVPIGLIAVASATQAVLRQAPGSTGRARAKAYLAAFVLQDLAFILGPLIMFTVYGGWFPREPFAVVATWVFPALGIAFALMLTRALLQWHVLDFDLKVKWTLRRGTLMGAFLAVFFIAAAIAEQWLQQYGVLVGGIAVGAMLFALRPLERAADRLADAAMPGVQDTPEYRLVRKREVYRAAVESALEGGEVTDRERGILATLAAELGLDPREAYDIERQAREATAGR